MADLPEKARDEFLSEAQELVESLSRSLLLLDAAQRGGPTDPSLINDAFRAVHTLKGLAGLFGAARVATLSHRLEDLLDSLRLGRSPLTVEVLDLLFTAVDLYSQLMAAEKAGTDEPLAALDDFIAAVARIGAGSAAPTSDGEYDLDPGILAVLTEYEEHRLRSNVADGMRLHRLRVAFDLTTIDRALDDLKNAAKQFGEIITYLPTGEATSPDVIELDLLLASSASVEQIREALGADNVQVEEIPRRARELASAPLRSSPKHPAIAPGEAREAEDRLQQRSDEALEVSPNLRSVSQTVRVDIRKLDHLMNIVGELAIVRGAVARLAERLRGGGQRQLASELMRLHRSFDRRLGEMQNGILEVRMVPLGQVFDRLARVVRQIGRELGKEIRLVITGAETEIDKLIVEELSDPLMHMMRNAIDHGIESSDMRARVGKPNAGTIALNAFQKGNHVVLEIEDDGRGIDEARLVERAAALGLVGREETASMSRLEMLSLVFAPGLSTRSQASDLSGRGVGMDVVKTNIAKLGGVIDVQSEQGIGTKFTVTLPITLAIVSALLVEVAGRTFAIPLASVSEAIAFDGGGVRSLEGREVMTLRGATLPLCRLDEMFGFVTDRPTRRRYVVVATLGPKRLGLVVDRLLGQEDIVIKALGQSLASVRRFAGATELGDQRVGLVIDPAAVIEEVLSTVESPRLAEGGAWHGH